MVVATYDRIELLRKAVDALLGQQGVSFELVVVDDGSSDGTTAYLAETAETAAVPFRVVTSESNGGPAAARNQGWRLARAPYVAFTDDDCEADPHWLRALVDAAARSDADIVQGRTIVNPADPATTPWHRAVRCEAFSHLYQTCNLLVRTAVLEELDGFDESYPLAAGEDCDLGWRATERGFVAVYTGDALVLHARRACTFKEHLEVRRKWAELVRFYKRHPEARRRLLYGRVFFRRRHVTVLVGTAVAALAAVFVAWWMAPVLFLAYVAYLAARFRTFRWRRAVSQPLADGWEIVHFAVRSVRHRTLVL